MKFIKPVSGEVGVVVVETPDFRCFNFEHELGPRNNILLADVGTETMSFPATML
ncbi:MAG: hypothetical protein WCF63_00105 [Acidimicrobiales bacterium]